MDPEVSSGLWPSYDTWLLQQLEALKSLGLFGAFIGNLLEAPYNILFALTHPSMWLDWSDKQAVMRFVYFGGSVEFFFAAFFIFLVFLFVGLLRPGFMWGCVRALEGMANSIGRVVAWAGLVMVLQQILVIFMQRVFAAAQIGIGFGSVFQQDVSWWGEGLKLHNAMIVALCLGYTFVQGGHVRVDLVYAPISFRAKRAVDMVGSLIFMVPMGVLIWMYGWFFMWRHLIVPNPSASDQLDRLLNKARALRWNVETTGFSPNGFNAYFLFKILLVLCAGMIILQAISFFMRSYREFCEGPESAGRYLDHDQMEPTEEALHNAGH